MKKILLILALILSLPLTASAAPFRSDQVGSSPQNGYFLQTNGSISTWVPSTGGGSGGGTFSTTTSTVPGRLINYPNNTTDIVNIGSTATTTGKFWFDPNLNIAIFSTGNLGIGTTSPGQRLSVGGDILGNNIISKFFTATSTTASIFPYASSTAFTVGNLFATKLSNLTSNGFVKTSGGDGTLSVDTNTYLTGSGAGVTAVSVASSNGFAGSSSGGATPALTLSTTISGLLKGNGTAISAGSNGTDYTLVSGTTCSAGNHVSAITASGAITCSADSGGGGGSSAGGTWSTTTCLTVYCNYPNNTTDIVVVGSSATTSAKMFFDPNTNRSYFAGNVGIGTTTPGTKLGVTGDGVFTGQVTATNFNATSTSLTTGTSTISGSLHVGSLFNGQFAPSGFFSTSGYHQEDIGDSVDEGLSLLTFGNRSAGTFAAGCLTLVNNNTPFAGGINATYNGNLCLAGGNFNTLTGLTPNALALDNTDGDIIVAALSSNAASSSLRFASGPGYVTGNYDLNLVSPNATLFPNSIGYADLGLGTTSPWARLSITASSTNSKPFFLIASSTNGSNSTVGTVSQDNVFMVGSNGRTSIGASTTPGSTLSIGNTGNNTINISETSTSTFGSGVNIRTGCFAINGSCISGGASGGTVTSVATNNGLTGGTFTTSGTVGLDITKLSTNAIVSWNGSILSATGTPQLTVGYVTATSTASSTFAGAIGIATTSPTTKLSVSGGSIYSTENVPATSTSMTVDLANTSNQILVQLGTSATTITLTNALSGMGSRVVTCNPNTTAGAVTFAASGSILLWTGGTQPAQTTTANKCDVWTFTASQATSTVSSKVVIFGAQVPSF